MRKIPMKSFLQEMLLHSGQFALFYLILQLIVEGPDFVQNTSHLILLVSLFVQTLILTRYGRNWVVRAFVTFLVPVVYSSLEMLEGSADLLNAAHVVFWIYAVLSVALMFFILHRKLTILSEMILVVANVGIFVFLYFYFDTMKAMANRSELVITKIFTHLPDFMSDKTHWFVIAGGAFLAITIALSRLEIERLKSRIFELFGKYVDMNIRDRIVEKGEIPSEKQALCVVFSDIKNFTRLCEEHDPEGITEMLNTFFDEWNVLVKKHGGTVDKYIGDAIMMIFGLQKGEGACDAAVLCATEMDRKWDEIRQSLRDRRLPVPDGFGIGAHYGEVIVGDIGSRDRKNFTIIGDAVNIAARLESFTRKTTSRVLVSSDVVDQLKEENRARFGLLGSIALKGKGARVRVFESLSHREETAAMRPEVQN